MSDGMYDLTVIGGGPAGASAAITAARNGAKVLLLERGRLPRHRVCGEFVSAESLGLLSTLLDAQHTPLLNEAVRIPQARIFLDGSTLKTPVTPPAASIARLDLDAALWESAVRCGVETRQQTTVQKISAHGPFSIETSGGMIQTQSVVNASGRWSNLKSRFSTNGSPGEKWLGIKAHFAEFQPELSVDLYFFDGGYCGVQPVDLRDESGRGRINACAMVRADVASSLPEVFQRNPTLRKRSMQWQPLSEPVSTSPLIFHHPMPVEDDVLLAGDAAGFVDPFIGDGISLALRSGAMAATSLIPFFRKEIALADALERYLGDYHQQLSPVFRASSTIRKALRFPRSVRKPVLMFMENVPAVTKFLVSVTR